jgi:hypothetical protein
MKDETTWSRESDGKWVHSDDQGNEIGRCDKVSVDGDGNIKEEGPDGMVKIECPDGFREQVVRYPNDRQVLGLFDPSGNLQELHLKDKDGTPSTWVREGDHWVHLDKDNNKIGSAKNISMDQEGTIIRDDEVPTTAGPITRRRAITRQGTSYDQKMGKDPIFDE